jgi:hypothetical protein
MHRPVTSQADACTSQADACTSQADACTYCMHCLMTSQAGACNYCIGSVVSILSRIYLYLQLLCKTSQCTVLFVKRQQMTGQLKIEGASFEIFYSSSRLRDFKANVAQNYSAHSNISNERLFFSNEDVSHSHQLLSCH